jgi:hypothetical protein
MLTVRSGFKNAGSPIRPTQKYLLMNRSFYKDFKEIFIASFIYFFNRVADGTQGLVHTEQVSGLPLSYTPAFYCLF